MSIKYVLAASAAMIGAVSSFNDPEFSMDEVRRVKDEGRRPRQKGQKSAPKRIWTSAAQADDYKNRRDIHPGRSSSIRKIQKLNWLKGLAV